MVIMFEFLVLAKIFKKQYTLLYIYRKWKKKKCKRLHPRKVWRQARNSLSYLKKTKRKLPRTVLFANFATVGSSDRRPFA